MSGSKQIILGTFLATMVAGCCMAVDLSSTEILNIEGRVEVKKGQEAAFKKLNRNLKLSGALKRLDSGDKVRTYSESSAEMALKETCILAVKEQSLFEVPKTLGKEAITQLKAQQGALLFKVISGSNFEVKTADVIAGVKGTLFELDIIDGFNTILETPCLELGTIVAGGTIVNVYRGEVELTHATTRKTRKLNAGQSLTVFNNSSMALNRIFSEGFGVIRQFEPAALLQERFGNEAVQLLNIAPELGSLAGFAGVGAIKTAIGKPAERLNKMFSGYSNDIMKKFHINEIGTVIDIANDFKDEKYKADFSGYTPPRSPFSIDNRNFREVYLGNHTFAACKAWAGSNRAKVEPTQEGLLLTEGNGSFRCLRFKGNSPDLEFVSTYQNINGQQINCVNVIKGELFARIPGELDYYKIPAGEVAYVIEEGKYQGTWEKVVSQNLDPAGKSYKFKVAEKIRKERESVDRKNTKKKIDGAKKIFRKFGF